MKGRKFIFAVLVLIFVALGGYLVLLSQGFVFDSEKLSFVKTGAIFLVFKPRDAQLEINGHPREISVSFFSNGALVNNLKPDEYRLRLSRPGFHLWEKTAVVEPGLVTAFENIVLVPEAIPTEKILAETIKDFWLTEAGIVYRKDSLFLNGELLRGETVVLNDPDYSLVVTETGGNYFLTDLNSREAGTNLTALFNSLKQRQLGLPGFVPIRRIFFHSFSPSKFLIFTKTALYELDSRKISLEMLASFENEILAETLGRNEVLAVDAEGNLITVNLLLKTQNIENNWSENIKSFHLSADGRNIIILHQNGKIEIIDAEKNKRRLLDVENAEFLSPMKDFNNYILLLKDNRLIISETLDGQPTNIYELAADIKKIEAGNKEIYFLQNNGELKKMTLEL